MFNLREIMIWHTCDCPLCGARRGSPCVVSRFGGRRNHEARRWLAQDLLRGAEPRTHPTLKAKSHDER